MSEESQVLVKELAVAIIQASKNVHHGALNTNSFISLGLLGAVVLAAVSVVRAVDSEKLANSNHFNSVESHFATVESTQNSFKAELMQVSSKKPDWTFKDMFKWCVHLQGQNDGTNGHVKIIVPEPEHIE